MASDSAAPGTPVIAMEHIHRIFRSGDGDLHALDDVSLTILKGEMVAIRGTSGSGKSTMLNILGCLDAPSLGTYRLSGVDVSHVGRSRAAFLRNRFIGFIFQNFQLLPRTSALEQVELPLIYAGIGRRERRARALEALTRVGLQDRIGHTPTQLSGGQQQRVAVARALVTQPALILADEPTGNLDSRTTRDIMGLLQDVHAQGFTVVMVTHDPSITRLVERVITMKDGKVASDERHAMMDARTAPEVA